MVEIAPPPQREAPRSLEPLRFQEGLVGLQVRLLIATPEALNPESTLPAVTRESLGNFADRDYGVFNTASTDERQDHWRGKEGDVFERQKAAWVQSTVATFTSEQAQTFFHTEKGKQWSEVFHRMGIYTQAFNQESAEQLYAKYFAHGTSDIKKFVGDAMRAHAYTDPDAIQWISHIFGPQSSEVVAQLLDAEKKLQTQPDQLVEAANQEETVGGQQVKRVNNLDDESEKRPLRFLAAHIAAQQPAQPDIPRVQPPVTEKPEQHFSPEQIADALIDYTTGQVRDTHIDLSATVTDLVDKALTILETEHDRLDPENIVLSDVARIMIDKLNTHANSIGRELAFTIQGVALEKHGKRLFVATYIVPTMEHAKALEASGNNDPNVYMENSVKLAQNTNLENLFYQLRQPPNGAQGAVCHIHHIGLGQGWVARPSQVDRNEVKTVLEDDRHNPYRWGVITKTQDGQLHYNLIRSTRNTDGSISEESIHVNN